MLSELKRLFKELWIVRRILSLPLFIKWLSGATTCLDVLLKTRSLGSVDKIFGDSFNILWSDKKLHFSRLDFGVVREIYGHLCYAKKGQLREAHHILDLGANGGAFTIFALVEAPHAQVYAVEAQSELVQVAKHNVHQNGYAERAIIECAVVGGFYDEWTKSLLKSNPKVKEFDIRQYIDSVGNCDFLKCDIEGAEFQLFTGDLTWTKFVKTIVLEFHPTKGDVDELEKILKLQYFQVERVQHSNLGYFYCNRS
ncbi:FkbM family methyltransferase [Aetokthonos hydrillicola Thurmond2011]|jgi:FkbM family methyltransferase|uniref:FkbM family methyltransferase n=1 Tax=Aetokthonos hydrillicola Thurmond2011 TaxID=2712845 RepID=A0AAP5MAD1_9CYAN|nr:FkbM family methyltransferase [Aetokthonos hydrillicola]MBO3460294.1 FkbM family methyltransferase [Aetokthonos hydrillicola CCALA 1050]MBW4587608.1 FkbM family methyltransferase [Aetokthonos hydrillicola CCALA 1050]MDR9898010.1 FkbM family methyltransferase [Aetokthonos hydrillicola Thurmond2011]